MVLSFLLASSLNNLLEVTIVSDVAVNGCVTTKSDTKSCSLAQEVLSPMVAITMRIEKIGVRVIKRIFSIK